MPNFTAQTASPDRRRYNRSIAGLMIGYGLLLLLANRMVPLAGSAAIKLAFAVLPALPVIGVFVVMGRHLAAQRDGYQQMLGIRQMLVATAFTLSVATVWGFGEDFDVLPHVPAFYAAILWFAGLSLGACVNLRLERGEVSE